VSARAPGAPARPGARALRPPPPPPPPPLPGWAYFFDIDGTLADIADAPAGARVDPEFRRVLAALAQRAGGAVALITGRTIADTDRLFPGLRLPVAGQHGAERRDAAGRVRRHAGAARTAAALDEARRQLGLAAARHPGLLLEDKGLSLALHYRRAPRLAGYAHRLVRAAARRLGGRYTVRPGKRVVELAPDGRDKGAAVLEFLAEPPFRGRTPVFVGDDASDEYGFTVVNRLHGHSVKVGPGRSAARWRLADVAAVRAWLASGLGAAAGAGAGAGAA